MQLLFEYFMVEQYLSEKIRSNLPFLPNQQQSSLIDGLSAFISSSEINNIFLLKGCAGTGKTSVVGALIRTLEQLQQPVILLAPTGRAAKILSFYSGRPAYTIHRYIYREKVVGDPDSSFSMNFNRNRNAVFVVDEASMIANFSADSNFGSGHLLDDLLSFVYDGSGCRIIFVGDVAQLPPVGEMLSPALNKEFLQRLGFSVHEAILTDVVRQSQDSGILLNATNMRLLMPDYDGSLPDIDVSLPDVKKICGSELIEEISSAYSKYGVDDTIIVSRSNKRVNVFNNGVRNSVLYREEELSSGDVLMVAKNNYFWSQGVDGMDFIANGDMCIARRVRRVTEVYGFRFADVLLQFPDYDAEIECKVLLDCLQSESPSLSHADSMRLFEAVQADYMDIGNKRERFKKMKENKFLNALHVKFGYAVTCHKAQGGQWSCVFLDKGFVPPEQMNIDFLRWLYTAFTRATKQVYLVNWDN